jgi:lipid A 3-O-deacylase
LHRVVRVLGCSAAGELQRANEERIVSIRQPASWAAIGFVVGLGCAAAGPAAAQVTLGSPGDPPRIAMGGGVFDVIPNAGKPGSGATGLALGEYRFGDVLWIISPFVGTFGTAKGAFYGYGGFGFDINFFERFIATPSAAVGYFEHGTGINLGAHTEFREGAEFAYRFDNLSRLGIGMYHMSNAGIGKQNPGVELVTVILTMPFR